MSVNDPGPATIARIPPAPPNRRRRGGDGRGVIWFGLWVLGVIVGVAFYQWLPPVTSMLDDWVTMALR